MREIKTYIRERLGDHFAIPYKFHPKTNDELCEAIQTIVRKEGNKANLNVIDVSKVEDFSFVFGKLNSFEYLSYEFKGDISQWDMSGAKDVSYMFDGSNFNGDISQWDMSNVTNMTSMFRNSKFNGDISNWDVSNVTDMDEMFRNSKFNQDISKWDVHNVEYMTKMFFDNKVFDQDLSSWNVSDDVIYFNFTSIFSKLKSEKFPKFKS